MSLSHRPESPPRHPSWPGGAQSVLDSVLFEPGAWLPPPLAYGAAPPVPAVVPARTRDHLNTPMGLLFNELLKSPATLLQSVERLIDTAVEMDTGRCAAQCARALSTQALQRFRLSFDKRAPVQSERAACVYIFLIQTLCFRTTGSRLLAPAALGMARRAAASFCTW